MSNKKPNGFTLAEVLITLVIIGVVAALTIPNVIYETKKKEYSSRLKKFYSTMKQVEQKAETDAKSLRDWAEKSGFNQGDSVDITSFLNQYVLPYLSYVKFVDGTNKTVYLNDGSSFSVRQGSCLDFVFDVNGDKKPNVAGRDRYGFLYCSADMTFRSYRWIYQTTRNSLLDSCKNNAVACSGLLMMDNWEFKDDYPYRL